MKIEDMIIALGLSLCFLINFNPKNQMKETLRDEYISHVYPNYNEPNLIRRAFNSFFELDEENPPEDRIIDAINSYSGLVNYLEFREYLGGLNLERDYVKSIKED